EEPDVSRILKVAEANHLEEIDDSFDHPLHSTAVDAYGEEQSPSESLGHVSAPQRESAKRSKKTHSSKASASNVQKFNTADPEDESLMENVVQKKLQVSLNLTSRCACIRRGALEDLSFVSHRCSVEIWCRKDLKRSARDITELDVVLAEFEKIAANYRQSIESNVCRKAISSFCSAFTDQVTGLIAEAQELKNMKKKNAKVMTNIKKERQQLLQLREKLTRAEPQLIKLQREYDEVRERKLFLRQATALLTDLKELQQDCLDYREENPEEKLVYGTSSLPALLVESRRILGAERHFENINMKLEEALDVQRGKLSNKH
ncbi:CENPU protein, partial [Alopecoenas beccarii]|nr:CENPU protein [Alopecoenas beccarii]